MACTFWSVCEKSFKSKYSNICFSLASNMTTRLTKEPSLTKLPTKFQIYHNCLAILNTWSRVASLPIRCESYPHVLYKLIIAFYYNAAWLVFDRDLQRKSSYLSIGTHSLSVTHSEQNSNQTMNSTHKLAMYDEVLLGHMDDYGNYKRESIKDCFVYSVRFRIDNIYQTVSNFNFLRIGLRFNSLSHGKSNKYCVSYKMPKGYKSFEKPGALCKIDCGDIVELTVNTTALWMQAENITKHEKSDKIAFNWIESTQIVVIVRNIGISIVTQWCVDDETLW
eukprot:771227_1